MRVGEIRKTKYDKVKEEVQVEVEVEYDRLPFSFPDLNLFCRW